MLHLVFIISCPILDQLFRASSTDMPVVFWWYFGGILGCSLQLAALLAITRFYWFVRAATRSGNPGGLQDDPADPLRSPLRPCQADPAHP